MYKLFMRESTEGSQNKIVSSINWNFIPEAFGLHGNTMWYAAKKEDKWQMSMFAGLYKHGDDRTSGINERTVKLPKDVNI